MRWPCTILLPFPGWSCRAAHWAQKAESGGRESNPRLSLILMPVWHDRLGELEKAGELPDRLKEEIEQFFLSATFLTGKKPKLNGWRRSQGRGKLVHAERN